MVWDFRTVILEDWVLYESLGAHKLHQILSSYVLLDGTIAEREGFNSRVIHGIEDWAILTIVAQELVAPKFEGAIVDGEDYTTLNAYVFLVDRILIVKSWGWVKEVCTALESFVL